MPAWVQRSVIGGGAANGTTSHTVTYSAPTAGNFLMAVVAGPVTFTTPTGWTLVKSAVGNDGIYVFSKTATSTDVSTPSFSTTHNGSNYAIFGEVFEYYAGSAITGTATSATGQSATAIVSGPAVTGLTGTHTNFAARCNPQNTIGNTGSYAWTVPSIEDYDGGGRPTGSSGGSCMSIAYDEAQTASSFTPSSRFTAQSGSTTGTGEGISWAVSVVTRPSLPKLRGVINASGVEVVAGATLRGVIAAGGTETAAGVTFKTVV